MPTSTTPPPDVESRYAQPLHTETLRADASAFLNLPTLPRYETVKRAEYVFYRDLCHLIPEVEKLTGACDEDDMRGKVALAGAGEARRRSLEIERAGLTDEFERVKRLARSVVALCDHYATLTDTAMCLVCDTPIRDGHDTIPYDRVSPSGGAKRSGRIHLGCANAVYRR
jgi:hypothetical protein